jgi:predicted alpha/beta-fold hydrolase
MTDIVTSIDSAPPAIDASSFSPPRWLRNPHVQSILPSLKLRRPWLARRAHNLVRASVDHVLDCGDGVRLLGHYSSQQASGRALDRSPSAASAGAQERPPARELAILLHGWEGSAESLYVLSLGSYLFERGVDVFRLNFRDHGPSHHLNEDIFHSCRLDEVVGAVKCIQTMLPTSRTTIAGFSLGGNFALRVAAAAADASVRLERAVAVCPVLRPHSTMDILEHGSLVYRWYFMDKWKRSLRLKQSLFPQRFDFGPILSQRSIKAMTEILVTRFSEFVDMDSYLSGYAIVGDKLANLTVPSHILFALDDPIIPASDLKDLARTPYLHINTVPYGGHCGFMDKWTGESWADRQIGKLMGMSDKMS